MSTRQILAAIPGEAEAIKEVTRFFEVWPLDADDAVTLPFIFARVDSHPGLVLMALGRLLVADRVRIVEQPGRCSPLFVMQEGK